MPRRDGLEAPRRIKAHNDGTSVILLPAVADEAHRQAADGSRGDAFLPKNARMGHALGKLQGTECSAQATSFLHSFGWLGRTKIRGRTDEPLCDRGVDRFFEPDGSRVRATGYRKGPGGRLQTPHPNGFAMAATRPAFLYSRDSPFRENGVP